MLRLLLLLTMVSGALMAQQPSVASAPSLPQPDTPATKPEDKCTLEGKVVSAATGLPVKKVSIRMYSTLSGPTSKIPTAFGSETDAEGKFSMKDLDPGTYMLSANRTGFVSQQYGAKRPGRGGTALTLKPGQHMKELQMRLTPHSIILGKIMDDEGDPLANVQVSAMRYTYVQGRKQLVPSGYASTNDLGEYRMFGIAPGKYLVNAVYRDWGQNFSVDRSAAKTQEESYAPTYYPGTTEANSASMIEVAAAGDSRGVDFRLHKARSVWIKGKVIFPAGVRPNANVQLEPRGSVTAGMFGPQAMGQVHDKGAFELRGVMPGSYWLVARIFEGKPMTARQLVDVGAANIENVELTFGSGAEVPGSVTIEGESGKPPSNLVVSLRTDGFVMYGNFPSGSVRDDMTFTLSETIPDQYNVSVSGLEENCYLKSVKWSDQELADQKMDLTKGVAGKLELVISRDGAQIEGSVNDEKESKVAAGVTVALIPESAKRDRPFLFRSALTDQNGHFQFKAVPPGDYKLFAWEDVEYGAYQDPDYLKPYENKGEPITVKNNGSASVKLKMIPVETGS